MSEKIHISNIGNNREAINTEPMKIKRINKSPVKVVKGPRLFHKNWEKRKDVLSHHSHST